MITMISNVPRPMYMENLPSACVAVLTLTLT